MLAEELPISRQAVVQHLAVLDAVGLVAGERSGRERRFAVRAEPLAETARWMSMLATKWDQRLASIRQIAESAEGGHCRAECVTAGAIAGLPPPEAAPDLALHLVPRAVSSPRVITSPQWSHTGTKAPTCPQVS